MRILQHAGLLSNVPYVRTVEIVGLDTLCKISGVQYDAFELPEAALNIYSRTLSQITERVGLAHLRDVDLIPHPSWKICSDDRYLVDEISHSSKHAVHGMESWTNWNSRVDIRYGSQHVQVEDDDSTYFLLGGDTNHYHWVLNFVPRLLILELAIQKGKAPPNCSLLVPDQLNETALGLLEALGYGAERITRVAPGQVLRFKELLVPSFFPTFELSPNVFCWYREKLQQRRKRSTPKRRVVISRGDLGNITQRRRVMNEAAVVEGLAPLGFESFNLGHLSLQEQIDLFLDAEFVVGPHGAGFANMAFCQPGTRAIVFENSWNHTFMVDMINIAAGRAEVMVCEDVVREDVESEYAGNAEILNELKRNRDMVVNVDALRARVTALIEGLALPDSGSCR